MMDGKCDGMSWVDDGWVFKGDPLLFYLNQTKKVLFPMYGGGGEEKKGKIKIECACLVSDAYVV